MAVTRARDRLYITAHRYIEGNCDASNVGRFLKQVTSEKTHATSPAASIALPNDPAVMTRQSHHGGEIEDALGRYAKPITFPGAGHNLVFCSRKGTIGQKPLKIPTI